MQLHRERDEIERRGARLVFIGNGNRHFAAGFRDELGITSDVYVDTERASYAALGFERGSVARTLRPAVLKNSLRALGTGFRQHGVKGDPWQLGGVLVVDPDARLRYRYASEVAGDHPPVSEVLESLPAAR